jgi:Xaa-Pro aminopeptidase
MKPGAEPKELLATHNKLLTKMGHPIELRLYAHGQGYDMVERPGIRPEETMTLKKDMFMAIHPGIQTKTANGSCCDNYLITNTGAKILSKLPREVLIV